MKCLSLRQPWAHVVLRLGKRIENRIWNTHYRGPVLLHAAKASSDEEWDEVYRFLESRFGTASELPNLSALPRGGIVGRARITGVVAPERGNVPMPYPLGVDRRWHMEGKYGFLLGDVEELVFEPYRGELGLFEVPGYVAQSLRAA